MTLTFKNTERVKILTSFNGHGQFKGFILEKNTILTIESLRYVGKDNRQIRNLFESGMIEKTEELPNLELSFLEEWAEKGEKKEITTEEEKEIIKKYQNPNLIINLNEEISKSHIKDTKIKLTTFFTFGTGYLCPAELRKSIAVKGNRGVGKDDMFKSVLSNLPSEDWIFLTNATQSVMEDDIDKYKIICFSETNLSKEDNGANVHLVEVLKQMTEGGTSSLKKDLATGFRTTKHIIQTQKSVGYGTTDTANEDELVSRFIVGSVGADQEKIKKVNQKTMDWFSGNRYILNQESWICKGIRLFKNFEVILPYAIDLPDNFVDCSDARSMRDLKRLLAIASSIAWFYQFQRQINEKGQIISELQDLFIAMLISSDFFNLTYSGVGDKRIQDCISAINEICDNSGNDFFSRRLLQQKMGVTINTIKGYLKGVNEVSIAIFDHKEGNDIIYRRCQKGVKKVLIGVNWEQLKDYFDSVKGVKIPEKTLLLLKNLENICKNDENTMLVEKIDTLKLTPSLSGDIKKVDVTHHKCYFCGDTPCVWFDEKRGNYLCETCRQTLLVNEEIIK